MLNNLHAIIFTNQDEYDLGELTKVRSIASVPYGGRYRMIDFTLSNCTNAGITDVSLVLQANYQSLLDHVESGKDWDLARKRGGLRLLPPFSQKAGSSNPRGRMEALANLGSYVEEIRQEYVLLADGDLAINIDLADVFDSHINSGADVTAVCTRQYSGEPGCTTYIVPKEDGKVDILRNPDEAEGLEGLNMWIMSKEFLAKGVKYCKARDLYSLTRHVLIPQQDSLRIHPYVFEGYAARLTSISSYYARSMDLLKPETVESLFPQEREIFSKDRTDPSTYYAPTSSVKNSFIADGCIIEGTVENSIIFRNVKIAKGAVVKNSILMKDVEVSENASINCVIADKGTSISAGSNLSAPAAYPLVLGKNSQV